MGDNDSLEEFDVDEDLVDEIFDEKGNLRDKIIEQASLIDEYSVGNNVDINILKHEPTDELIYHINEPDLTEFEEEVRYKVTKDIEEDIKEMDITNLTRNEISDQVRERARNYIKSHDTFWSRYGDKVLTSVVGADYDSKISSYLNSDESYKPKKLVNEESMDRILYYVERDMIRYERLTPILNDKFVEDISCNGAEIPTFVYHNKYNNLITDIVYTEDELDLTVSALAQRAGEHISIANPNVAGRLEGGYRMQLTLSDEISPKGSNFTIRKFKDEPFTPIDLIQFGTFSLQQMAYLWLAIENDKSLIFAGGTASGKTTSMNAISLFIPPRSKVITIEDTQEIVLQHSNWVQTVTRSSFGTSDSGEIDMYDLLRDALRQRPEYIIVGEIRGSEAQTLFQAMNTGHTTYSTMHADSVRSAINRLEHEPINLPRQMLNALDIISIQVRTESDGEIVRRCKEMVEIENVNPDDNTISTRELFEYDNENDVINKRIESKILEEIQTELNLTDDELQQELQNRKNVLEAMLKSDKQYDYRQVTEIIRRYHRNPEQVLEDLVN